MKKHFLLLIIIWGFVYFLYAQEESKVIDEIIAVVGDKIVLKSDLEIQYLQYLSQANEPEDSTLKCKLLDQILLQKLLLVQSILDSIEVTDDQVEEALNNRIQYFSSQFGSKQKLEEYYKKSVLEIKEEFRPTIKEHLLVQKMQSKITDGIKITPAEIKKFYNEIPKDSLPFINSEIELGHIVRYAQENKTVKEETKEFLEKIKQSIIEGESFESMAVKYSQDPGSSKNGGTLGFINRGELVSEFEAAAFKLKENEISAPVETPFGFHIIQLIERRGESINLRHILIKPQTTIEDLESAKIFLDSIAYLIAIDTISFADAARKFSNDVSTKANGGMMYDEQSGTTKIPMDQIDPTIFLLLDTLKVGSISSPVPFKTIDGKQAYRLIYFKSKTAPHRANLTDDYQRIQAAALAQKQEDNYRKWFEKKLKNSFVQIDKQYQNCEFMQVWVK